MFGEEIKCFNYVRRILWKCLDFETILFLFFVKFVFNGRSLLAGDFDDGSFTDTGGGSSVASADGVLHGACASGDIVLHGADLNDVENLLSNLNKNGDSKQILQILIKIVFSTFSLVYSMTSPAFSAAASRRVRWRTSSVVSGTCFKMMKINQKNTF